MHFDKNGAINLLKMENFVPTHVKTEISRKKNHNFPVSQKYKKFGKLPTLVHQPTSLYMHIKMRRKEKGTRILKVTIL